MSLLRPPSTLLRAAAAALPALRQSIPSAAVAAGGPRHDRDARPSGAGAPPRRSKHSATQVKRLFNKNPARRRVLKNRGEWKQRDPNIPERKYPEVFKPRFLSNGWSAPPPPEVPVPEYPFGVVRTGRKPFGAAGFLPVYRDIKIHGTKHTTIIRKVSGDISAFISELRAVLQLPEGKKGILTSASTGAHGGGSAGRGVNRENPLRIRTGSTIEVNGDRAKEVKGWLAGLGF
ncbi:hypothetical protein ACHAWF_008468 [Thalassiosira exigua]